MIVEVRTSCRLHFGLLAFGPQSGRQFGGLGLMVRRPEVMVRARLASQWHASGRMSDRALEFADRFIQAASAQGWWTSGQAAAVDVIRVARPHTGLGSGTQLAMAVGQALATLAGRPDLSVPELAAMTGRGKRSAIGAYGFKLGGFLVDGGKSQPLTLSPLVHRQPFPEDWRVLLIRPRELEGLAGQRETQAFADMPPIPPSVTDRMCRQVLLGLLPALAERRLDVFGESLYELQQEVGRIFAPFQGGIYAHPLLDRIVRFIRAQGASGVGQSSWGPTLYAFVPDEPSAENLAMQIEEQFNLHKAGEVIITSADNQGSSQRLVELPREQAQNR